MKRSMIIPLPPGSKAERANGTETEAVGLYPCTSDGECNRYMIVMVDNKGKLYADCTNRHIEPSGCTRSVRGLPEDRPEQTHVNYMYVSDEVTQWFGIPTVYQNYLDAAWQAYNTQGEINE